MAKISYIEEFTSGLDCNFHVYKGKTKEQRRKEMISLRGENIGASDVGKILGASRWGCSTLVYREKKGLIPPKEENWRMLLGSAAEEAFIAFLRIKHPHLKILDGNKILCKHKEYDFLRCNPDAMIIHPDGKKEGLEFKNIHYKNKPNWSATSIPDDYYSQCQCSMYITGLDKWRLAVSFGDEPVEYFINRDNDFIENDMLPTLLEFKRNLNNNEEPPVDTDYYDPETFVLLFPEGVKSKDAIIASKEVGKALLRVHELIQQSKNLESEIDDLKALCMFYMGEKDGILVFKDEYEDEYGTKKYITASARMQTSKPKPKFSAKLFQEKFPDDYSKIETDCLQEGQPNRSLGWITVKGLD